MLPSDQSSSRTPIAEEELVQDERAASWENSRSELDFLFRRVTAPGSRPVGVAENRPRPIDGQTSMQRGVQRTVYHVQFRRSQLNGASVGLRTPIE
ncbi:hypothetical protein PHSY_003362 [Pseudozyma hubeiensis SY62]|uniref:Uncharacterized protein n=1 Tax=Pseudozyma hubeiensis (strain SY62) TaxID=1305764 RepID=R9P368_PSEHS|nr:hypothetical protein PHSY_003362 [Pseudozyma hubeiensis SY62]GAC95786.1 hypothetical protein PHSY_003362 [Pseudozyma hubeiensis SY62]